jgi:hypothetical protein
MLVMFELSANAYALLELVAEGPLSVVPPLHQPLAEKLSASGLMVKHESRWYASAEGLKTVGRTLH